MVVVAAGWAEGEEQAVRLRRAQRESGSGNAVVGSLNMVRRIPCQAGTNVVAPGDNSLARQVCRPTVGSLLDRLAPCCIFAAERAKDLGDRIVQALPKSSGWECTAAEAVDWRVESWLAAAMLPGSCVQEIPPLCGSQPAWEPQMLLSQFLDGRRTRNASTIFLLARMCQVQAEWKGK